MLLCRGHAVHEAVYGAAARCGCYMERTTSLHAMHLQPFPTWYVFDAGAPMPVRLLDDAGRADPALSGTPHGVLASLAEAIHAAGHHFTETQLRHLELFVALQRWRR